MERRAMARLSPIALGAILLALVASCNSNSPTAPSPVLQTETFTGTLQVQTPVANFGQELFAPNGASPGTYCVQIFDCPTGATGCC